MHSCVFLAQVSAAEQARAAELLLPCPKLRGYWGNGECSSGALQAGPMSGTWSIISLLALQVPNCITLDKLLYFHASVSDSRLAF